MAICPRCRREAPSLLRPQPDILLCGDCWDLLLLIAAGGSDEVDSA